MTVLAVLPDLPPEAYLPVFGALVATIGVLYRREVKRSDREAKDNLTLRNALLDREDEESRP